jgi:hypothetical protein
MQRSGWDCASSGAPLWEVSWRGPPINVVPNRRPVLATLLGIAICRVLIRPGWRTAHVPQLASSTKRPPWSASQAYQHSRSRQRPRAPRPRCSHLCPRRPRPDSPIPRSLPASAARPTCCLSAQPCLVCQQTPCDAHHLKFAQPRALGRKVSDEFTVPLCPVAETAAPHRMGAALTYARRYAMVGRHGLERGPEPDTYAAIQER